MLSSLWPDIESNRNAARRVRRFSSVRDLRMDSSLPISCAVNCKALRFLGKGVGLRHLSGGGQERSHFRRVSRVAGSHRLGALTTLMEQDSAAERRRLDRLHWRGRGKYSIPVSIFCFPQRIGT